MSTRYLKILSVTYAVFIASSLTSFAPLHAGTATKVLVGSVVATTLVGVSAATFMALKAADSGLNKDRHMNTDERLLGNQSGTP